MTNGLARPGGPAPKIPSQGRHRLQSRNGAYDDHDIPFTSIYIHLPVYSTMIQKDAKGYNIQFEFVKWHFILGFGCTLLGNPASSCQAEPPRYLAIIVALRWVAYAHPAQNSKPIEMIIARATGRTIRWRWWWCVCVCVCLIWWDWALTSMLYIYIYTVYIYI